LEPYWADFAFIIEQLKKLLGEEAVDAIHFDEDRLGSGLPMCSLWPVQDNAGWHSWRIPPADVPVLVLGDLGVDDRQGSARIHWQRLARRLRSHPAPLLALSPTARSPVNKPLCRQFRPNPLNDVYGLPRHPAGNGFVLDGVGDGNLDDILALLSPLPLIDAGLLRRLRDGLQWGGSELESAIWNHPDMRQTGLGIRLREQVAEHYRQQYQQHFAGKPQAERLWQIVQEHHAPAHEGLRQLEKLNQCVLENRDDHAAVQDYLKRLCATVAQGGNSRLPRKALMMQCRTILASRPEGIWDSALGDRAYDLYALAYEDEIRAGQWPNMLEEGFDPARLQWVLDAKARGETVQWLVVQTNDQGRFSLRPHNPDQPVHTPVARLEALKQIPPVLHFPLEPPMPLEEGAEFEIPDKGVVAIHSASHRIELEAITKPSWATQMWRDATGLWAGIPWRGKEQDVMWQVPECRWGWQSPFGEDDYGLYADLTLSGIPQRFRWIEPGTFLMGSPESEAERWEDEVQHPVTLTQGFWLADTTVTQSLWQTVMGKNPSSFTDNPNNPVKQVSWNDSQEFIKKLNGLLPGLQAKLPTEAQWEYACRAGTTTPFYFGNNITPEQVNYDGNNPYAGGKKGLYREKTVPVKSSLPANLWGLYEMHGNVWEWCQDVWQEKLPASPVTDPEGVAGGDQEAGVERVVRGGSWSGGGGGVVRSAFRFRLGPAERNGDLGFRLALGLELQPASGAAEPQNKKEWTAGTRTGASGTPRQAGSAPGAVDKAGKFIKGLKNLFWK
jgi:formylglycine-generating enzyme required for sulfatase activity